MKKWIAMVASLVIASAVLNTHAGTPNSSSKSGAAVAFAKVNLYTGSLLAFGGKGTATATLSATDSNGWAEVTFTGKYPKDISADQVIITATCQTYNYGVANAYVSSVSSTQLVIGVYGWKSDTTSYQGDSVFFSVFIGQQP